MFKEFLIGAVGEIFFNSRSELSFICLLSFKLKYLEF